MKKVSVTNLVIAIILIVCSVALFIFGFSEISSGRVVRHMSNGFMRVSYVTSAPSDNLSLTFVVLGGFLLNGGILLLILSAITAMHPHHLCGHKDEPSCEKPALNEHDKPEYLTPSETL